MIEIKYGERVLSRPECWEECSPEDFERLALCQLGGDAAKERPEMWDYAVAAWLGVLEEWDKWRLTVQEWILLKKQVEWVFTPTAIKPFNGFLVVDEVWLLPEAAFGNCKAIELAMGFVHYVSYVKPGDSAQSADSDERELALDRLICTFCRPRRPDLADWREGPNWDGDEREVYNESRINDRLAKLKKIQTTRKMAFLAFFEVNLREFFEDYAPIFGAGGGKARYENGMGMIMMLKDVAKQGHFGDFERVCMQPLHLVWTATMDDVTKETEK
jgi:hypothetical protein